MSSCRCSRSGGRCCRSWGWRECSCWTRSGRWRRSWAGWRDIDIALSASRRTTGAVAEVLSKERVVSLHSGCGRCVAISHCAVDHIEASLPLVQPQLEAGTAAPREVLCPPLDVEDAVGSSTTYRCEDAEPTVDQIQVVPVRENGVVVGEPRQADVSKGRIGSHKLGIPVGGQIGAGEGLAVQGEREGERDRGDCIIPVIANVHGARHNAAAYLNYRKTCAGYRRWGRCRRRRRRWAGRRRRRRRWCRYVPRSLDYNWHGRAGLKVAYRRIGWIGRLIGIKPEVIQRAEANRVRVLILRKSFGVPGYGVGELSNIPRCAAISSISLGAIMCKARMLKRRMKSGVRDVYSGSNRHTEGLDGAIEILVIERVFIVPDASTGVRDFIAHEPDTVGSRRGLDLVYCRAGPSHDRRLLSHGGACGSKTKGLVDSGYGVLTVRSVVIHVALARMTLAPGAFVGDDVFRFGKIRRPWV